MPVRFPEEKRLQWKERIRLQQESGQTIALWCREQQVNYDSFLYWKGRFSPASAGGVDRSSFKELLDLDKTGITIEYQQIQIHLSKNFDPSVLMKCLRVLKGEAC